MRTAQRHQTFVVAWLGLCALMFVPAPGISEVSSQCSTSAVFAGCDATCDSGMEASCETQYSLFNVNCTCGGWKADTTPFVNSQYQAMFGDYIDLLSGLGSPEASRVAEAAQGVLDAALEGDMVMFDVFVEKHTQAYGEMSDQERNVVFGFFGSFLEGLVDFFEGVWNWVKDRFADLWEFLKDLPAWVLEGIKDGSITVEPLDADGDGTPDGAKINYGVDF